MNSILQTLATEIAVDMIENEASEKRIRKMAQGVAQIAIGIILFPFQLCGRIFKANKPLMVEQGIRIIQKNSKSTTIATRALGYTYILFGMVFLPLELCGRIFHYRQPLMLISGIKKFC